MESHGFQAVLDAFATDPHKDKSRLFELEGPWRSLAFLERAEFDGSARDVSELPEMAHMGERKTYPILIPGAAFADPSEVDLRTATAHMWPAVLLRLYANDLCLRLCPHNAADRYDLDRALVSVLFDLAERMLEQGDTACASAAALYALVIGGAGGWPLVPGVALLFAGEKRRQRGVGRGDEPNEAYRRLMGMLGALGWREETKENMRAVIHRETAFAYLRTPPVRDYARQLIARRRWEKRRASADQARLAATPLVLRHTKRAEQCARCGAKDYEMSAVNQTLCVDCAAALRALLREAEGRERMAYDLLRGGRYRHVEAGGADVRGRTPARVRKVAAEPPIASLMDLHGYLEDAPVPWEAVMDVVCDAIAGMAKDPGVLVQAHALVAGMRCD